MSLYSNKMTNSKGIDESKFQLQLIPISKVQQLVEALF